MKRIAMTALAAVLLAQAAPATAQDRGDRGQRMEQQRERPQGDGHRAGPRREWRGGEAGPRSAPRAPRAAEAPAAPRAAEPQRQDRPRFRGDGSWTRDRDDRGVARHQDDGRRDGDRRDWDRRDRDRRDWDRRDRDRWDDRRHSRWERGRYPSVYFSPHRYRHHWRQPSGYYLHIWSYGDYLPGGWWGPDWWLVDPWDFGLPLPPPGYEWVRVGEDALMVDRFTGRIVQVVRNVFW